MTLALRRPSPSATARPRRRCRCTCPSCSQLAARPCRRHAGRADERVHARAAGARGGAREASRRARSCGSTPTATSTRRRRRPAASSAACRSPSCSAGASTSGACRRASSPPLPEERAVLVGGRDLDPGERDNVDRSHLHEADDAAGALAALPPDAPLYVHVDTDVLDPSLTPGRRLPRTGRLERRAHARRARGIRRERPRRRALGLPERAAGARCRGPRALVEALR